MAYCKNCGNKLQEGANFCTHCGSATLNDQQAQRKFVYDGELHKCPSCGEVLEAFIVKCPSCGYELRGNNVSASVREFSIKLERASNDKEKSTIIRSFPVPNTKEDIIEFLILATSNVNEDVSGDISEAWCAKIEQIHKKANLLVKNEPELTEINNIYHQASIKLIKVKAGKTAKDMRGSISKVLPVLPNIILVMIWLLSLFASITCSMKTDGSQILLILVMLIGTFLIPRMQKCPSAMPKVLIVIGLVLSGLLIFKYAHILNIIIFIVCSIIIIIGTIRVRYDDSEEKNFSGKILFALIGALILAFAITGICTNRNMTVIQKEKEEKQIEEERIKEETYNSIYEWPTVGLSQLIPKPVYVNGIIEDDTKERFRIEIYKVSFDDYKKYVDACKNAGFTLYITEHNSTYTAYNSDEFELSLYYFDEDERFTIIINPPYEIAEITWPKSNLAKSIPKPSSSTGYVFFENEKEFSILIDNITDEQYNEYVDKCMEKGFDLDYSRNDTAFNGHNKKEYALSVERYPFDRMYIRLHIKW